jgi:prolyl-tRNA synthetase
MGCYGIGVTRLAQLLLSYDNKGLLFPDIFKPYDFVFISKDGTTLDNLNDIHFYEKRWLSGSLLIDDRNCSFGTKIKDAELMGLNKIILSKEKLKYEYRSEENTNQNLIIDF